MLAFFAREMWLFSDYSFSHFLVIAGDYLSINVGVLWRCGEYVDELNFCMALHQIS